MFSYLILKRLFIRATKSTLCASCQGFWWDEANGWFIPVWRPLLLETTFPACVVSVRAFVGFEFPTVAFFVDVNVKRYRNMSHCWKHTKNIYGYTIVTFFTLGKLMSQIYNLINVKGKAVVKWYHFPWFIITKFLSYTAYKLYLQLVRRTILSANMKRLTWTE